MVRGSPPRIARRPARPIARRRIPRERPGDGQDIIVTASKQNVSLLRYPGSLTVIATAPTNVSSATGDLTSTRRG